MADVGAKAESPSGEAFAAFFTEQYPRVYGYLLRRTGNHALAEDCAAETFTIAWQHAGDGVPHPGWVFATARNVLANRGRAETRLTQLHETLVDQMRRGMLPGVVPPPDYDDPAANRLVAAMDLLPSTQRELLIAHYWDGLSGSECAELFNCSPAAIWVRLHRARRALANEFLRHSKEETS